MYSSQEKMEIKNEDRKNVLAIFPDAKQKRYEVGNYGEFKKFWIICINYKNPNAECWIGTGPTPRAAWKRAWEKIAIGMVRKLEE